MAVYFDSNHKTWYCQFKYKDWQKKIDSDIAKAMNKAAKSSSKRINITEKALHLQGFQRLCIR